MPKRIVLTKWDLKPGVVEKPGRVITQSDIVERLRTVLLETDIVEYQEERGNVIFFKIRDPQPDFKREGLIADVLQHLRKAGEPVSAPVLTAVNGGVE